MKTPQRLEVGDLFLTVSTGDIWKITENKEDIDRVYIERLNKDYYITLYLIGYLQNSNNYKYLGKCNKIMKVLYGRAKT